jgi:anti-anti-sigma factor
MADHEQVVVVDTSQPSELVVRLIGDLDVSNVHRLREALEAIGEPHPHIILELADLTFMDSSGLGVLLEQTRRGATVTLRNPAEIIRRLVAATGLTEVLRLEP